MNGGVGVFSRQSFWFDQEVLFSLSHTKKTYFKIHAFQFLRPNIFLDFHFKLLTQQYI